MEETLIKTGKGEWGIITKHKEEMQGKVGCWMEGI